MAFDESPGVILARDTPRTSLLLLAMFNVAVCSTVQYWHV